MPKEITDLENIDDILNRTTEIRSIRISDDVVKIKFRTESTLYTIKLTPKEANKLKERVKGRIKIIDFAATE